MMKKKKNATCALKCQRSVSTIKKAMCTSINMQNLTTTTTNEIKVFVDVKQNKIKKWQNFLCGFEKHVSDLALTCTRGLKKSDKKTMGNVQMQKASVCFN